MARAESRSEANRVAGVYAAAFLSALVVLALLGHFGLQDTAITVALAGVVMASFAAAALGARTMNAAEFFVAGRSLSAPVNGLAIGAAFMSGGVYLGLAGAFYAEQGAAIALTFGWSAGFLLMAVLIAPFFRRAGAYGVAGFLAIRFGGRLIRLLVLAIVTIALMAGLASAMATAAFIGRVQFAMPATTILPVVIAVAAVVTIAGGMRSTTTAAVLQYLTLAIAFVIPAALISTTRVSMPLPHFSFGFAQQQADRLATAAGADVAAPLAGQLLAAAPTGMLDFAITVAALAAGVAALPHLIIRTGAVGDANMARRSLGWGLVFTLAVILLAPAYAALARLGLLVGLADLRLRDLPEWVLRLNADGQSEVCGTAIPSLTAVFSACPLTLGASTPLKVSDVALNADALVLAWPSVLNLPQTVTSLLTVGALAALSAVMGALTLAIGGALGNDLFGHLLAPKSSAGRRMIMSRLAMFLALVAAARIALIDPEFARGLALWSVALSAGGLAPALVLAIWWRRANVSGAVTGMLAGFGLTLAMLMQTSGAPWPGISLLDVTAYGLSPFTIGFFGLVAGTIVMMTVSLATPRPSSKRLAVLDAIRRGDAKLPVIEEKE